MNSSQHACSPARSRGFTLTELLIALAIVAILTSVAFPLYNNYTIRSHRAQLMTDLGTCAQALERFYTVNFSYLGAAEDPDDLPTPPAAGLCPQQSPQQNPRYNIVLSTVTANNFVLRGIPIAGTAQEGNGVVELRANGQRFWYRDDDDAADAPQEGWDE
ncbi:MAG: prepilin-type N-terminal cleavage/methylation domain-containing protein [Gammaproteobacteria bacterium]|nr:prepilin-type N-terminal cleavage/methylation domain-containing protein [Gammaproteobacteria bacterium]